MTTEEWQSVEWLQQEHARLVQELHVLSEQLTKERPWWCPHIWWHANWQTTLHGKSLEVSPSWGFCHRCGVSRPVPQTVTSA